MMLLGSVYFSPDVLFACTGSMTTDDIVRRILEASPCAPELYACREFQVTACQPKYALPALGGASPASISALHLLEFALTWAALVPCCPA